MKQLLMTAAALAVVMVAAPASAAVTQFTDRTAFEAAAGAVSTETFEGFANMGVSPSTDLGAFTVDTNGSASLTDGAGGFNVNGSRYLNVNITSDTGAGGPGSVTFTFDTAITAFGADFRSLNNNVLRTYAVVGGITFDPLPMAPNFLGFVSDTAFTTVTFFNPLGGGNNDQFGLDNLTTSGGGAIPEPGTWALMIGGFGLAGAALRRRQAATA